MFERPSRLVGIATVSLLVGCGVSSDAPDPMGGCIEVGPERMDVIQAGLIVSSGFLREAWAYPRGGQADGYFVAAEVEGPGFEGDGHDAVFFVMSLDSRGLTFSVSELAIELSDWPDGSVMEVRTTMSDPGVEEALACLSAAQEGR